MSEDWVSKVPPSTSLTPISRKFCYYPFSLVCGVTGLTPDEIAAHPNFRVVNMADEGEELHYMVGLNEP